MREAFCERSVFRTCRSYADAPATTRHGAIDFSPDGTLLAVGGFHEVLVWKADGSGPVARLVGLSERIESVRIPVLAGIVPLESLRHAEFMGNEVPGVSVPEVVLDRMRRAEDAGRAREEGLTIARELVSELAGRAQGLQVTVASGAVDSALQVLEAIHA